MEMSPGGNWIALWRIPHVTGVLELISACFPGFGPAYSYQTDGGLMPELRYDGDNAQEALVYFKTHRQEMRALRRVTLGTNLHVCSRYQR
jgi:hypothetical protein